MDCNLMQYIYRPLDDRFDSICVWEFVQQYEMKLQSSLSNSQRENMESDFEENFFIGLATIILGIILHVWKS